MCLCSQLMCHKPFYQTCMESTIIIIHIMPHVAGMYMHSRMMNQQLLRGKESMIVDHGQQKCQLHNPHLGGCSVLWTLLHSYRLTSWFTYLESGGVIAVVSYIVTTGWISVRQDWRGIKIKKKQLLPLLLDKQEEVTAPKAARGG